MAALALILAAPLLFIGGRYYAADYADGTAAPKPETDNKTASTAPEGSKQAIRASFGHRLDAGHPELTNCNTCCCPTDPVWTVRAGAAIMRRERPDSFTIYSDFDTGAELLNAADYDFGFAAGVDLSILRQLTPCDAVEFRFFGVPGWSASETTLLAPDNDLNTNPPIQILGCEISQSTYDSELFSAELNWRRRVGDRLIVLAGFRYLELNEDLQFLCGPIDPPEPDNAYKIETDNTLLGLQVGVDRIVYGRGRLRIDGLAKAGIYYNAAHHRGVIEQPPGDPVFGPIDESESQLAFVGEASLTATYQLTGNISARVGYQLMWVNGVALASDQIGASDFENNTGIDVKGDVFYHGALLGLEIAW